MSEIKKRILSKKKGNAFELYVVQKMKELGFEDACSSRSESKKRDDEKVDVCFTGNWNIQCKATEKAPNYHKVLKSMPEDGNINVIWHKRNRQGTVVTMSEEDFLSIVKKLKR